MAQHQYISKHQIKALSRRSDFMGLLLVFHCWGVIFAAAVMFIVWPNPLTFFSAIVIIGARQLGLAILFHDAAHGILFKTPKLNHFFGQYLLAFPVGSDLPSYRKYHLIHHLNTQQENDPDLSLSAPFPISKASLRRKVLRDLTGMTGLKLRIGQLVLMFKQRTTPAKNRAFDVKTIAGFLAANLTLLAIFVLAGVWWAYFALWLLPLLTVFQLVLRIRNIAEHALTTNDTNPLTHARTVEAGFVARCFVAPYWVNYHVEHHAYMYVPCWQLKGLHKAMIAEGHGEEMEIKGSYSEVLKLAAAG